MNLYSFCCRVQRHCCRMVTCWYRSYLLMHDDGQLPGQVSVVGLHLIVILLLVLLNEPLIDA